MAFCCIPWLMMGSCCRLWMWSPGDRKPWWDLLELVRVTLRQHRISRDFLTESCMDPDVNKTVCVFWIFQTRSMDNGTDAWLAAWGNWFTAKVPLSVSVYPFVSIVEQFSQCSRPINDKGTVPGQLDSYKWLILAYFCYCTNKFWKVSIKYSNSNSGHYSTSGYYITVWCIWQYMAVEMPKTSTHLCYTLKSETELLYLANNWREQFSGSG